ncbi:hypothetical protein ACH5RR_000336 [Cinchona calisaya]|uniref:Major facilitator superfamily (MFS) profile domain-containing protein n=1 Tax=Cinchona calisaya TaxID=153742 RepID=A0ABD3B0D7_9GENT
MQSDSSFNPEDIWEKKEGCPLGTIPIRRRTKRQLQKASAYTSEALKQSAYNQGVDFAGIAAKLRPGKKYFGASAYVDIYNPQVLNSDQFSSATIAVQSGDTSNLNEIQVGWIVYPAIYGDYKTRLYTSWTADYYHSTGCYNIDCPAFVSVSSTIPFDYAFPDISTRGNTQYDIKLRLQLTVNGYWLVYLNTNLLIGYWPSSIFTSLGNGGDNVLWGGQVFTPPTQDTSPPMGSSTFINGQKKETCYMRQVLVVDNDNLEIPPDDSFLETHDSRCYFEGDNNLSDDPFWAYYFLFGGEGGKDEVNSSMPQAKEQEWLVYLVPYSYLGSLLAVPLFLHKYFPGVVIPKKKALRNTFCGYIDFWLLVFPSLLPLSASASVWLALTLGTSRGRRFVLVSGLVLLLVGLSCVSWFTYSFLHIVGIILIGSAVGFLYQVIPVMCSELAPLESQDRLKILYEYQVYSGSIVALLVAYIGSCFPDSGWKLCLEFLYLPVIVMLLISVTVDETPEFLIQHINNRNPLHELLSCCNRPTIVINTFVPIVSQMTGTRSLTFFAPLILVSIHSNLHEVFLAPLAINLLGLSLTALITHFLDLSGRRKVILGSLAATIISQILLFHLLSRDGNTFHLGLPTAYVFLGALIVNVAAYFVLSNPHGSISDGFSDSTASLGAVWTG